MKKVMISQLCRFYHGEKESPYLGDTSILWSTEKSFADAIIKNNKRVSFSEFHDHIIKAIRNRRYGVRLIKPLRGNYPRSMRLFMGWILRERWNLSRKQ